MFTKHTNNRVFRNTSSMPLKANGYLFYIKMYLIFKNC